MRKIWNETRDGTSSIWTCRIFIICFCFLKGSAFDKIKTNIDILNSTRPNRWATKDKKLQHVLLFVTYNISDLPPISRSSSSSFFNLIGSFSPFPSGWKHKTTSFADTSMTLHATFLTNLSVAVIGDNFTIQNDIN